MNLEILYYFYYHAYPVSLGFILGVIAAICVVILVWRYFDRMAGSPRWD